jgi:hypothetical protein
MDYGVVVGAFEDKDSWGSSAGLFNWLTPACQGRQQQGPEGEDYGARGEEGFCTSEKVLVRQPRRQMVTHPGGGLVKKQVISRRNPCYQMHTACG